MKEIILKQTCESNAHQRIVEFCREHYAKDSEERKIIKELKEYYRDHSPIWWSTRDLFLRVMMIGLYKLKTLK